MTSSEGTTPSSDTGSDESRPSKGFLTGLAAVFLLLVLVGGLAIVLNSGDEDSGGPGGGPDSTATIGGTPAGSPPTSSSGVVVPDEFVTLPTSTSGTNGYPTGYPHTPEGAAATSAANGMAGSTLDYEAATDAIAAYMLPPVDAEAVGEAIVTQARTDMGLALQGDPPVGVDVTSELVAVKWKEISSSRVGVWTAARLQRRFVDGRVETVPVVTKAVMRWSKGRWWTELEGDPGAGPAFAEPGTQAFKDAGWAVVKNDDWLGGLS